MYNLHHEVDHEGSYIACSGSLDDIKKELARGVYALDDVYLTMDSDVDIYALWAEMEAEKEKT